MKSILLLLSFIFLHSSVMAMDIKLSKPTREGRPVVLIDGTIEAQKFPLMKLSHKTIIVIGSQGGHPNALPALVTWFKSQLRGARPTVIVKRMCSSTCIGFLATLNNLAGQNRIELIVDARTRIGFHGCLDLNTNKYQHKCTLNMIRYLNSQGMEARWLNTHLENFSRPTKEFIVNYSAEDAELRDSGLLNHARIERFTANLLK